MKVMAGVTSHGWCRLAGEAVVSPHGDTDERVGVARWGHGKEAVCSWTIWRKVVILVSFGAFFSAELHRRVRCLAMDGEPIFYTRYSFELDFQCHRFEVNQHPIADVIPVLLKSGQSASLEEVVEEIKDCRSMVHPCHRSTVIPERGPSIFQDRLKPRSNTKLPNTHGRPETLFMYF
ncbi:hypothetical protein F2Q70_00003978 [Brassica cretica]|uniref:Uncharacterized protein n=1 Tax=Brassica cretica TaxID=69181 RepID=A0A8S9IVD2_BRACR|nr:hypothetical protein F2Q70_00003978 [Brassica cretica]